MRKIEIYDTTLRDGSQSEGISYSVDDKIAIAKKLDEFGIPFIEGGWPYSNPKDKELFAHFKKHKLKKSSLVPFGSTCYVNAKANKDKNLLSLLSAGTEYVTIFGKSWDFQVKHILRCPLEENLRMIYDSVKFLVKKGKKVFYDAEHFFDGLRSNKEYALKTISAAYEAGAHMIVLCDTNGGVEIFELMNILADLQNNFAGLLGVHFHNDSALAVANSLLSVKYGVVHIQGTINGYGERCGNADLIPIISNLQLKMGYKIFPEKKIKGLSELSHFVSEISNVKQQDNQPFVGRSAFAHKGGIHIDAVIKNPLAYEHIDPALVGNKRRFLVSELAGKSSLVLKAKEIEFSLDKKSHQAKRLHKLIQNLEKQGYQFEAAEASFKLLLMRQLRKHKDFFKLIGFRVIVEKTEDNKLVSSAIIKVKVKRSLKLTAAEGDGPVNALDNALRKALADFYPELSKMHLTDFKVRVLNEKGGTAAKVRVLITSQDDKESWSTMGVSENIIEASWQALADSVEYKLLKSSPKR